MSGNKTRPTDLSVETAIQAVEDEQKRRDCQTLQKMMRAAVGEPAVLWGDSLIGFGQYHYRYDSGREGDFFLTGFAPRKNNLSIYILAGFDRYAAQLEKLGKHKLGRGCLYVKTLAEIDTDILREIIEDSVGEMRRRYPDKQP